MKHRRRVVVSGFGAISALGDSPEALWQGLMQCRSGVDRLPFFADAQLPVSTGGAVASIPFEQVDRDEVIANHAIGQALSMAGIGPEDSGFVWATGLDTFQVVENGMTYRSAGDCFNTLAEPFGGPKRMIATACASGTQAIGEAFRLVGSGSLESCIAGGSSTMLTPFYLVGFAGLQAIAADRDGDDPSAACRPFDRQRSGFALADGAGALLIESLDSAQRRGAKIYGEILGFGSSQDAFDLNRPPADGSGALLCMRRTLADAAEGESAVDAISAHGTATHAGDLAEAAAIRALLPRRWESVPVFSIKGAIGHPMSAAGALEGIVALHCCGSGFVPPTVNLNDPDEGCELRHVIGQPLECRPATVLSVSFGMGGQNAGVLFRRFAD